MDGSGPYEKLRKSRLHTGGRGWGLISPERLQIRAKILRAYRGPQTLAKMVQKFVIGGQGKGHILTYF